MAIIDHFKGHIFAFDPPPRALGSAGFWKLLFLFAVFEYAIGPRMGVLSHFGLTTPPEAIRVALSTAALLVSARLLVGPLSRIGLRPWKEWSLTEKSYFVQTFLLANAIFIYVRRSGLTMLLADPALIPAAAVNLLSHIVWGFYQEAAYRGVLQTALANRFGAIAGILVANVAFTLGPLHFYHFAEARQPVMMFGAIFAIGSLFGVIFQRSGNLPIVGVLHGLGDWYLIGL